MIDKDFSNVYEDERRAAAYATLGFPGTYYLAYRDVPALIAAHVTGTRALDFGCGTGRSTRFLRDVGFDVVGVDISPEMIAHARAFDPEGDYRLLGDDGTDSLAPLSFDLVLSVLAFDNIPDRAQRAGILARLRRRLGPGGRIIIVGSAPEIYLHEWASFSTRDFPENRTAKSGDHVRVVMTDVEDSRPVVDILWTHDDYLELFAGARLDLIAEHRPLGRDDEPFAWVSETTVAPWVIYVLGEQAITGSETRGAPAP